MLKKYFILSLIIFLTNCTKEYVVDVKSNPPEEVMFFLHKELIKKVVQLYGMLLQKENIFLTAGLEMLRDKIVQLKFWWMIIKI